MWKDFGDIDGCEEGRCPFATGDGVLDFYGVKTGRAALHWSIILAYVVSSGYYVEKYHLSQNYYITARYFLTINFGRRNVMTTSQKLSWNYFWAP